MQFVRAYYSERKMLSPVKQRVVRQPISVKSRMPKGAKERTALIRYTAQGSVTISVSRKQNCLPDEELSAFYEKMKQDVMSFVYALEAE